MLGQLIPEVSDTSAHSKSEAQGLGGAFMVFLYHSGGQHLSLALSPELRDSHPRQLHFLLSVSACCESDGPFHSRFYSLPACKI